MRTIMATGDNIVTAIAVGKDCKIIQEYNRVFMADLNEQTEKVEFVEMIGETSTRVTID
jgi:magnesium-transporting ATPase (P-type)